jgi:plastocyanin
MKRIVLAMVLAASGPVGGADKKVSAREEIARLEKELAAQRALLVRMLELQSACTAQMIRAARGQEAQTPELASVPEPAPVAAPAASPEPSAAAPERERAPSPRTAKTAAITGKVRVSGGGPAWVFVEDVKGPAPGGTVEIKQQDKQFVPRIVAVPAGSRLSFPNLDVVHHNVFSLTPGQTFDLGMSRAGDPVKSKTMNKPGVLEIFCNLHARMSATVLVTPGPLLTRVASDGSFTLENVPVGAHRVSAWAGGQVVKTQALEVGPGGATAQFELSAPTETAHTNKLGQPYGSYAD